MTARRLVKGRARQFCVIWQKRRCSILFHLEVPGGKPRSSTRSGRPGSEAHASTAGSVGAAAVGRDHQPGGRGIEGTTFLVEPGTNGVDRELGGIAGHTDTAAVVGQIVDAIGHDLAEVLVLEVMNLGSPRLALGTPSSVPLLVKLPTSSFFLVSTEITG